MAREQNLQIPHVLVTVGNTTTRTCESCKFCGLNEFGLSEETYDNLESEIESLRDANRNEDQYDCNSFENGFLQEIPDYEDYSQYGYENYFEYVSEQNEYPVEVEDETPLLKYSNLKAELESIRAAVEDRGQVTSTVRDFFHFKFST